MGQKPTGPSGAFSLRVVQEIERARKDADLTATELVKRSGIGANTYFTKMRGERPFNTNEIDTLASAMNVEPEIILRRAGGSAANVGGSPDPIDLFDPKFKPKPASDKLAAKERKSPEGDGLR